MTRTAIDLTGKRFGMLKVIERNGSESSRGNSLWLCQCDCGGISTVRSSFLRKGVTKSCGCFRNKRLLKPESAFNTLLSIYKKDAIRRGYTFDLSREKFKEITSQNCIYCGQSPYLLFKHRKNIDDSRGYTYNGIDRKNNLIGYTDENSVSCCKTCNVMKGSMNLKDWDKWIEKIAMQWFRSRSKKRSKS